MAHRTPSEALVLTYLRLRQVEGRGGATRQEITQDTGVSDRTLDRALTQLSKQNHIEKRVIWEASNYPPKPKEPVEVG